MLGPGIRPPLLYCTTYSKAVFCLLQSLFRFVPLVEAIYRDFLGSLLWHITKGPMVPFIPGSGTTVSVGLPAALSQITPLFTCWGRTLSHRPENLGGKNRSWITRQSLINSISLPRRFATFAGRKFSAPTAVGQYSSAFSCGSRCLRKERSFFSKDRKDCFYRGTQSTCN